MERTDARRMWMLAEPFHALTYFAPESHRAFEAAGLRGFWRGYFAGRAAPLGVTPANVVTATCFGFHPAFVSRAIPSIWSLVDPADAIAARLEGIDRATRALFDDDFPNADAREAATAIRGAVDSAPVDGRPLFAANVALDWPASAPLALWHAVTLLREHRGDGHVSALLVAELGPADAHVLRIATDGAPLDSVQPYRGWDEEDWADASARLHARGWLDGAGVVTVQGRRVHAGIERDTDRLSIALVNGIRDRDRVASVLRAVKDRIDRAGIIPYPNPIGLPTAADRATP